MDRRAFDAVAAVLVPVALLLRPLILRAAAVASLKATLGARSRIVTDWQDQAAPLDMMWNSNPSTIIPTATAAIGSRTSMVAFAPLTGPVHVSNSLTTQS
jgi:hypothetical protein